MKNHLPYLILITALVIWVLRSCEAEKIQKEQHQNQIGWLQGDLKSEIDKLGRETSSNTTLIGNNAKEMAKAMSVLDNLSSEQERVLQMMRETKNLQSSIALSVATALEGKSETTIKGDSVWPEYSTTITGKWMEGQITANRYNFDYNFTLTNEFDIKQTRTKKLFKPDSYDLSITNLNPYTRTTGQSSFLLTPAPKRMGIGLNIGYGLSNSGLSPFVGVGINYNVICF